MGRRKLQKFAEMMTFPHVYENRDSGNPRLEQLGKIVTRCGTWRTQHFENQQPIVLELACGRGEYAVALGRAFPEKNFIGVDIKGARIWEGAKIALDEQRQNVAFLRTRIEQISLFFDADEVDEIWITFPDPFLRESKENRRLTSPYFLSEYRKFLKQGGIVHLKTDSPDLYAFTLDVIENDNHAKLRYAENDIYSKPLLYAELQYKTYYEKKNIAQSTIKYIQFTI